MPQSTNKISNFWQELKRRKVVRVITVYAAAAFVILELVSIIVEPLRLPEWTLPMIIVLLCIGFIIAVILSWVYDVTPEGIEKTKPAQKVKEVDKPVSSSGWKIASYIGIVVIIILIVLNIIPRNNRSDKKEILDKSIAVLPFINDSPDNENVHIINGIMEDLLINLQSIKELRVPGRTSTEQYRNNPKSIPEIANEMNVAYIVEGSGQRYGNKIRLRVQLVEGSTDKHIWADSYDEVINGPEDIFRIQSQIAKSIANELQAVITPAENKIIEKVPTNSLTAYDLYQRGNEEFGKYWSSGRDTEILEKVEEFYKKALSYDSSFAEAYVGLADVYLNKRYWNDYFNETYLDSVLIMADIAISYDKTLSKVYLVRGLYFSIRGDLKSADREFDIGIAYNPNDWRLYYEKAVQFQADETVKRLENAYKAASLHRGPELVRILRQIANAYLHSGFYDLAKEAAEEVSKLGDLVFYYHILGMIERYQDNYQKSIELFSEMRRLDTTWNMDLALNYTLVGQYEESLKYYKEYLKNCEASGIIPLTLSHRIGYAYWMNGYKKEAEDYFRKQLEYDQQSIQLGRRKAKNLFAYYDLAAVYAFFGEKEKAMEYLRIFNRRQILHTWAVHAINNDPLFDSIRDEPEFQQIVKDVETKHQAEHERVRQWLEENDMR